MSTPGTLKAPRFPLPDTKNDVADTRVATTHGALYVALYVDVAHEPVGAAAAVHGLGHVYARLYVNVVADVVVHTKYVVEITGPPVQPATVAN